MRKHILYANLKKCIFAASEIALPGCIVRTHSVVSGPEKIKGDHQLARASRCQGTEEVRWASSVLAQVLAELRRDDCASVLFTQINM